MAWKDGDAWALRQASSRALVADHYRLIAGFVSIVITKEPVKDCNGVVIREDEVWTRKWKAEAFDMGEYSAEVFCRWLLNPSLSASL